MPRALMHMPIERSLNILVLLSDLWQRLLRLDGNAAAFRTLSNND